jgi:histone deacetylase 1/2
MCTGWTVCCVAASEAAKEAIHLRSLAQELGLADSEPLELFADNTAAIDVAYNPEHHTRMKHVERRHFFVREAVEDLKIRVPYVNTADNLADFFTKPLSTKVFSPLRNKIMNIPPAHVHSFAGGR